MKLPLLLSCLFILLGGAAVNGQLPVSSTHLLLLDVENKGAGGAANTTGITGAPMAPTNPGSATNTAVRAQNHSTTLGVTVRNQDKTPDEVQIEWYFFAKDEKNYHVTKEYLFDSGSKTVTIQPTGQEEFDVASKTAQTFNTTKLTTTTVGTGTNQGSSTTESQSQGGTKISGWVVRMLMDGKVLDARGSDFKYEDAAKDPDKFAALKAGR